MLRRLRLIGLTSLAVVLLAGLTIQAFLSGNAAAAQITSRSLTLQAGATDGGSKAGGVVNHYFQFTLPSTDTQVLQSILFMYCTLPGSITDPCTTPTGLVTTTGTITMDETGSGATGFSLVNTVGGGATNGNPYITRTAGSPPGTANLNMKIKLLGVTNPTTTNQTFFVRIASYASTDTTGSAIDTGTVAASTATQIQLSGTMPESLVFCTGATISLTSGVPDCSTATSGIINFNQLFSPTSTASATSQMAASTNAGSGYAITINGPTLTSGGNTVTAIGGTATTSQLGVRQFGLNLVADTTPAVDYTGLVGSGDISPVSDGVNYMGAAATNFNTTNNYAFVANALNTVALSNNGSGPSAPTDAQIFTSSYIVNVSGNQPAGTYTTTLTYICTPTF